MGSGKTFIGKRLAMNLNIPFVDLDAEIVKFEKKSINKIFIDKGEMYFRKIEKQYLKNILSSPLISVISLGGGTPCYYNTINDLNDNKINETVFLRASIETLTSRLYNEINKRPKIKYLNTKNNLNNFIRKHLFERNHYYNKSKHIIDVDNKSIIKIIEEIILKLT